MTAYKRGGNKWTVNELLSLQREYELLEMSIQQIAAKHERSITSILFKLETEGFIDSWNSARGFDILEYQRKWMEMIVMKRTAVMALTVATMTLEVMLIPMNM